MPRSIARVLGDCCFRLRWGSPTDATTFRSPSAAPVPAVAYDPAQYYSQMQDPSPPSFYGQAQEPSPPSFYNEQPFQQQFVCVSSLLVPSNRG